MRRERSSPNLIILAIYIILVAVVAAAFSIAPPARAADEPIDLDESPANGEESKVSTKVVNTYPVEIENTVFNNAMGESFDFRWPGAGPGGFDSFTTAGPGVGTIWLWSSVYQVYAITSPITFTPQRSLPVFGEPSDGIDPIGSDNDGTFSVPGRSIFPDDVTLSDASLTASWISFFSPEQTRASCAARCIDGDCELSLSQSTGGTVMMGVKQEGCCDEPNQTICGEECKSYLTDPENCGGCDNVCGIDEFCSEGTCLCPAGETQCGDGCFDLLDDDLNCGACDSACPAEQFCSSGTCACDDPSLTVCEGACFDVDTDPLNCGACGNVCGIDEFCSGGACVYPAEETQCGDGCFDLLNDDLNCGTCDNVCAADQFCSTGVCDCDDPGRTVCDGTCVDLQMDVANCGGCGNACGPEEFCGDGQCQPICTGLVCGEECIDPASDPLNCGACGTVCGPGEMCSDGLCVCPAGETQCGDGCFDLSNDDLNCGACGSVCPIDQSCAAGVCVCDDPAQTVCDGACFDLDTDAANCGACGNVCGPGEFCSGGACMCPAGETQCGDGCFDFQTDDLNCGGCDNACAVDQSCTGGACVCDNQDLTVCGGVCVRLLSDEQNCGSCGNVCDPSRKCIDGECRCDECDDDDDDDLIVAPWNPQSLERGGSGLRKGLQADPGSSTRQGNRYAKGKGKKILHPVTDSSPGGQDSSGGIARALDVLEAPVCDVPEFQAMVGDGETVVVTQPPGRVGREVQVTVSIEAADGEMLAQGPCPVIVPLTDLDTTGAVLTVSSVVTNDSSGDGLCQPTEESCGYFIELKNSGDSPCISPLATLQSPANEFALNEIIMLNSVATYDDLPAYPGDGIELEGRVNQQEFSITTLGDQDSDVGRPYALSVQCQNLPDPVIVPFSMGFGSACTPEDIDGETYDHLDGLLSPLAAVLLPDGGPVNFANGKIKQGSTAPLKLVLSCGDLVLNDSQIDPNPAIVSVVHTILGPQLLTGINGDNNANPDSPLFSCTDTQCDFQMRTDDLPVGDYIIGIQMPDSRVFRAGFTLKN